jgi:hypothetical protein
MFAQIATSAKASNEPTNNAPVSAKATARRSTSLPPSVPRASSLAQKNVETTVAAKTPARPQKKLSRPHTCSRRAAPTVEVALTAGGR